MIWKAKIHSAQTRVKRKFAWLPVRVGEFMVWLKRYEVMEYNKPEYYTIDEQKFEVKKWTEIARRLI